MIILTMAEPKDTSNPSEEMTPEFKKLLERLGYDPDNLPQGGLTVGELKQVLPFLGEIHVSADEGGIVQSTDLEKLPDRGLKPKDKDSSKK